MSSVNENQMLMERALAALDQELSALRADRERLHADYMHAAAPLDREIARLETARSHQQHALAAITATPNNGKPRASAASTGVDGIQKLTDVAAAVLSEHGAPMHYKTIAEELVKRGVFISAKDPGAFVIGYLRREPKRFCRAAKAGEYALVEWELSDARPIDTTPRKKPPKRRPRAKVTKKR